MFKDYTNYEDLGVKGVIMPSIPIDKKYKDEMSLPENVAPDIFLKELTYKGLKKRGLFKEGYIKRVDHELNVLKELLYTEYILAVWDICNFADEKGILRGGGRGSAAGSLVLYAIGVTEIDSLKHSLYFERFVSKARAKSTVIDGTVYFDGSLLCDVDLDFEYTRRIEVLQYIEQKYPNKTAKILTVNTMAGKACFKDVMKIVGFYSEDEANEISETIPKLFGQVKPLKEAIEESEKFKNFCDNNKEVFEIACKIENLKKNYSVHPSGVAISNASIKSIMPTQLTGEGELVTGVDMKWTAEIAVKFDILGLRTLTVVDECCKMIGIKMSDIDPEDPFIYKVLQDLECPKGIFQIEADSQYRACKQLKPENLEELSDLLGLVRPGAVEFLGTYIDAKKDGYIGESGNEKLDEILKETKGVAIYQETLLKIAHVVFGFSLEEAEIIRRITSKKKPEEMKVWEDRVFEAAKKNKISDNVADYFWKLLQASASYSFNKCLSYDTLVKTLDGEKKLCEVNVGDSVLAFELSTKKDHFVKVIDKMDSEVELFEFKLKNNNSITCSMDHKFLTNIGMKSMREILENNLEIKTEEVFKDVVGYEGLYQISNKGEIISLERPYPNGSKKMRKRKVMKQIIDRYGYRRIELKNNGNKKKHFIHKLVLMAFSKNPLNLPSINHKNGIKDDNSIENLEWISIADNNRHAFKSGLNKYNGAFKIKLGEDHPMSKLKESDILEIRKLSDNGISKKEISILFGIDESYTHKICKKESWKHI